MRATVAGPTRRRHEWALSTLLAVLAPGAVMAQVSLVEVMADPAGSDSDEEFVELRNDSDSAWVDLAGWSVGDADELDGIADAGAGTLVPPGGLALVLDASYFGRSSRYDSVRSLCRIVTIEDRSFGRFGWSNSEPERVRLVGPDGDLVDEMTYDPSAGRPGHSWERSTDGLVWQVSHVSGGTPGVSNSVNLAAASSLVVEASPDPFEDRLEIRCRLPAAPSLLAVTIFDAAGRRVVRLRDWGEAPLETTVSWNGTTDGGQECPPGLYVVLAQMNHAGRVTHGKIVVARR